MIKGQEINLKHILVPVDFSDSSIKALRYALAFAKEFKASLTLLHVAFVQPEFLTEEGSLAAKNFLYAEAKRQSAILIREEVLERGVEGTSVVLVGNPPDKIVKFAQEAKVDLIVLATHGRTGVKRFLMGGTTERVVRLAPCPVLVVRPREHEFIPVTTEETPESRSEGTA